MGWALARRGIATDGLDLWPRPAQWPAGSFWHQSYLQEFDRYSAYAAVLGSLIFHQFTPQELAGLGAKLRKCRLILASEPARLRRAQVLLAIGGRLLGANYVTRHDARVSVAAGFVGEELPHFLGLPPAEWQWECRVGLCGSYRMVAIRKAAERAKIEAPLARLSQAA